MLNCPIRSERHESRDEIHTSEYMAWNAAKSRCFDVNHKSYANYGGRGIRVCDEWLTSYKAFLAYMGRKPSPKHQLGRIDNNGNYEPGNVCWSTPSEQMRNTRRSRMLTYNGVTLCVAEWAEKLRVPVSVIATRLRRGWSIERTLTIPPKEYPRKEAQNAART